GALHEVALYDEALKLPEIQRRYRKLKGKLPVPTGSTFNNLPESSAPPMSELQPLIGTAIERGVERLLLEQYRDGSWGYALGSFRNGATSLAVYTLLKCGLLPDHPAIVRGLQFLRARHPIKVYSAGVQLMALGATGDAGNAEWAEEIVDLLLGWESEAQPGSWGYPGGAVDLSNSQFAALGFWGAHELGLDVPKDVWERMLTKAVKDHQPFLKEVEWAGKAQGKRTGKRRIAGFTYFKDGLTWPETGTMTTAGLCVIGIPRMLLGKKLGVRAGRLAEQGTQLGMGWLEHYYSMDTNPVLGDNLYYYLYGMERVGAFFNTETIGGHPWYRDGADVLVRKQKDNGHWGETESDTAFALLFLRRASAPRQSGSAVDRRADAYADASGTVHLHATGSARMTMWIQDFQEGLEEDFEGSDRLWRGIRVIEVQYWADGELVASVAGDPSKPWSGERYATRYTFPLPGEHTLTARVRIVSPYGDPKHPGEGGSSEVDVIESAVMQVVTKNSPEDWMAANLEQVGEDLLQGGEPTTSASTSLAESGPGYAVDGSHSTRWVCTAEDSEPWINVKLGRSVRASAILLSQANSKLSMRGQYAAIRRIALSINRGKPVEVELGPDDLRQVRIELDRKTRIRELRVIVLQRAPTGAPVGFSGIELR
ncbi:MAG: discoidin domain-containing protein, partial [Planctomycetota bacterium]|nr:discoidin domain-containing protein [Planctomycetota bacterium]